MLRRPVLYIRFRPDWISVRNVITGASTEDSTAALVDGEGHVIAVGAAARASGLEVVNGFAPSPGLLSDFDVAVGTLSKLIGRVCPDGVFALKRDIVVHPLIAQGSQVSDKDFKDLARLLIAKGAYHGYVHVGAELDNVSVRRVLVGK